MLPCAASSEVGSTTRMASCRVSTVDQRFSLSASSTSPPQLTAASPSAAEDRQQQHATPFHFGLTNDLPSRPTLGGASHGIVSVPVHHASDDQPLDLTGGGAARKRRGSRSPSPEPANVDSPLDLSVKRSRTAGADTPLSSFSVMGVDRAIPGGARGGLAMCGGGVVGHSPLRSVHVARSPVPLSKLHAAGHQVPTGDVPRLSVGAVPVIRRVSSTSFRGSGSVRGSRIGGGPLRPSADSSRMISDEDRLPNARHARDVTVMVNGHRPEVLVGAKDPLTVGQSNVVRPAFTRIDYASERRGMGGIFPGRQGYLGKAYDRGNVTILGGRSHLEPLIAASPTSVSSLPVSAAYVTPPPPVRPNAVHSSSVARRLDSRSKVFPTLASFPESSSSLMSASHRVTLVDRLDPTEPRPTFLPPNVVASSSLKDVDSGGLYFGDSQSSALLITAENSGDQLRAGFSAPVWNSLVADVAADSERTAPTKSSERSSAFGGLSPAANCVSEVSGVVDDRRVSGDGASTIVAERNFAVTQMVKRACSTSGGSLLGHLTSTTRCVPVANVHPIMKEATQTAATASPSSTPAELPGPCRRLLPATDDDTCSQLPASAMSISSGRSLEAPSPAKDVKALLAAGLSRGGRVSSHQTEYVKFLRQTVDDTASVASLSVTSGTPGHSRSVRSQQTVDKRRGSTRGGVAGLSAKARRQLLPHFHHDQTNIDQRHPAQTVLDKAAATAASDSKTVTTEVSKNAAVTASSCSEEHISSCASLSASSTTTGRKTTPIVYFDDDESTEAPSTSGSQPPAKHWRQSTQGSSTARKQPGKPRKIARADWNAVSAHSSPETAAGKPGGTLKQRKRVNVMKNDRSNDEAADDDDLTDFEDVQPSTSAQVSFLHL